MKNVNQIEERYSGDHSTITEDITDLISGPYGCGMCEEMFKTEKTFLEHCYHHYYDASQKGTFLNLKKKSMCLVTCIEGKKQMN